MYKSLMFKTNPLAEELSRYKQKQLCQGRNPNIKNKRSYDKPKDKLSHQNKFINIANKIIPKYPKSLLKRSINLSPQSKKFPSPEQNKKCTFKIKNHSFRNDNFLNQSISPQVPDKLKLTKRYSLEQKQQNPLQLQFPQNQKDKILNNEYMQYSVDTTGRERKKNKKSSLSSTQKSKNPHVTFSQPKKPQQAKTMTTQNELKSTLYQSIDLGNIFEKIDSKIDLSKAIKLSDKAYKQNDTTNHLKQNRLTERNSKQVKMIEKLKSQLTSQTSKKPSQIISQFNIKSLIEKKLKNQRYAYSPNTPQPESITARDPYFPKPTEIDSLINSLNFNDYTQKTWMPSTRKKSSVIIIDDKGNIIEDNEINKLKKNRQQKIKMSSKIAKLREVIKPQQMIEKR